MSFFSDVRWQSCIAYDVSHFPESYSSLASSILNFKVALPIWCCSSVQNIKYFLGKCCSLYYNITFWWVLFSHDLVSVFMLFRMRPFFTLSCSHCSLFFFVFLQISEATRKKKIIKRCQQKEWKQHDLEKKKDLSEIHDAENMAFVCLSVCLFALYCTVRSCTVSDCSIWDFKLHFLKIYFVHVCGSLGRSAVRSRRPCGSQMNQANC